VKFSIKAYKLLKIKNQFKHNHLLLLCNATTTKNNIEITQKLKKLNLQSYSLYKTLARRIFANSIYQNHFVLINGLVTIVAPKSTLTLATLARLNEVVTTVALKIDTKIYSITQLSSSIKFKYPDDCANLMKTLRISLKKIKKMNYS